MRIDRIITKATIPPTASDMPGRIRSTTPWNAACRQWDTAMAGCGGLTPGFLGPKWATSYEYMTVFDSDIYEVSGLVGYEITNTDY